MGERDAEGRAYSRLFGSYTRASKWSRLTFVGFAAVGVVFVAWITPWLGVGMRPQDYSAKVIFTLLLLLACGTLAVISLLLRNLAAKRKEAMVAWTSVFDEVTGLRNRRFFGDRLAMECERRGERSFGVLLFEFELMDRGSTERRPPRPEVLRAAGHLLARETRTSDIVAVLSRTDLAVLATPLDAGSLNRLLQKIGRVLLSELPDIQRPEPKGKVAIKVAVACYGIDGTDPLHLLRAARDALRPLDVAPTGRAAA